MADTERVTVNGAALAYREHGKGEPLLLLHPGFVADGMMPLLDQPALRDFRAIAYHRRGYGASGPATAPLSTADAARDAFGLLDELGIERAHLVGHSMGATVAVEMTLSHPERVASLTLMEPLLGFFLGPDATAFVTAAAERALPLFAAGDAAAALDAWLTGAFGLGFRAVLERRLPGSWAQAITDAGTSFGIELPALQQWPCGPTDLGRIAVPALSVVHLPDAWPGFAQIHHGLLDHIPGCQGRTVTLPSHLLQIADPQPVAEAVAGFLVER